MEWTPISGGGEQVEVKPSEEPSRATAGRVLLIVLAVAVMSTLAVVGGAMAWMYYVFENAPVAEVEDRAGLINIVDVQEWAGRGEASFDEWIDVEPFVLGSRDWTYESGGPMGDPETPWIQSYRTDDLTTSDARASFMSKRITLNAEARGLGAEVVELGEDTLFERRLYVGRVSVAGVPRGVVVVARQRRTTFGALLGPVSCATKEECEQRLKPILDRAMAFTPSTER